MSIELDNMNKDRQFMNTRVRFKWNGHSFSTVRNPWDEFPGATPYRDPVADLLPSVFKDTKQTAWRRGALHLNPPGDTQRFQYYGNKNNNFKLGRTFHKSTIS